MRRRQLIAFLVLTLTGCATVPPESSQQVARTQRDTGDDAIASELRASSDVIEKVKPPLDVPRESTQIPADIENLTIGDVIRIEEPNTSTLYDNSRYDFPITVNSRVEGWIDYFTGRGRPHFERYLARSSRYIPIMKQTFKRMGLPEDLVYLAMIESGFNMRARSRARAVGPWQFIKGTGQRYGLKVNGWIDERRDPIRSTEAAAKYLKDLYLMFESWYLAASAYNAGEHKILRAIEVLKTNNYWRISEGNLIRRETKDYIPKLIAAAIIAKNPKRYGFEDILYQEPLEFEIVTVDFPLRLRDIASFVDTPTDELEDLNPELKQGFVPAGVGPYEIRVPIGMRVLVERALSSRRTVLAQSPQIPLQHVVKAGETLITISKKFGLRTSELASANNMSTKEKLLPGVLLVIPKRESSRSVSAKREVSNKGEFTTHVVRRGESLWSISEKYNVTIQDLFHWNNLKRSQIRPGKRLKVRSATKSEDQASSVAPKSPSWRG